MPSWWKGVRPVGAQSPLPALSKAWGEGAPTIPGNDTGHRLHHQSHQQLGLLDSKARGQQATEEDTSLAKQEIWGNYFWNVSKAFCYFHYCRSKDTITGGGQERLTFQHMTVHSQWTELPFYEWLASEYWTKSLLIVPFTTPSHLGGPSHKGRKLFKSLPFLILLESLG